eukprot:scaffold64461_cov35-Tisochrysis_lutea.AAC.3
MGGWVGGHSDWANAVTCAASCAVPNERQHEIAAHKRPPYLHSARATACPAHVCEVVSTGVAWRRADQSPRAAALPDGDELGGNKIAHCFVILRRRGSVKYGSAPESRLKRENS